MANEKNLEEQIIKQISAAIDELFEKLVLLYNQTNQSTKMILLKLWSSVLEPTGLTGVNVLGYLLDKIVFGGTTSRQYFQNGVLPHTVPDSYRDWIKTNSGWDIYTTIEGPVDNVLGAVLGLGFGLGNYVSHFATSFWRNLTTSFNLLGANGVFGPREPYQDNRHLALRIIFGLLSAPFTIPTALITNVADGVFTTCKHFGLSVSRNLSASFNLLSDNGVFGPREAYQDDRHLALRIIFGLLSAPVTISTALIANVADGVFTVCKHFGLSVSRNIKSTFNLLGDNGIFGPREPYQDDRHLAFRIIFGLLSAPITIPTALVTNVADGLFTACKHFGLSVIRNTKASFNLLGDNGIFGPREPYQDERHLALRIIFGLLSAPITIPTALVTNVADGVFTTCKHFGLSVIRNTKASFNLLGDNGVFGPREPYQDDRHLALRIIFGLLSAPITIPTALVTNVADGVFTTCKHFGLSVIRNTKAIFNLLGDNGVFGPREPYQDDRHLALRIIFGLLSAPFTIPTALITNVADGIFTTCKHFGLSVSRNLSASFNLLSDNGVFGPREPYQDDRHLALRIIFGLLSAPITIPTALVGNVADGVFTTCKHFALSMSRNIKATFNLLGDNGVFGSREPYQDDRHIAFRIIFGLLSSPLTIPIALITNIADGIFSTCKQFGLSVSRNLSTSFNLLGDNGVFGPREAYQDDRHLALRIIFGLLSAPITVSTALVTNVADGVFTACKHFGLSVIRNTQASFNLLGDNGVFGPRNPYLDDRHLALRIIFGLLSAPIVFVAATFSNLANGIATAANHTILNPSFWKKAALLCLGVPIVLATAIPFFCLRKFFHGLYNFTVRPVVNAYDGKPFDRATFISGVAEFVTLGIYSLFKKGFKGITGYTKRFGFDLTSHPTFQSIEIDAANRKFKEAIHLAARGQFPTVDDEQGIFRPMMRLFYRMRHPSERIAKEFHNAYQDYVTATCSDVLEFESPMKNYSISGFFAVKDVAKIDTRKVDSALDKKDIESLLIERNGLPKGEEEIVEKVKAFLIASPAA